MSRRSSETHDAPRRLCRIKASCWSCESLSIMSVCCKNILVLLAFMAVVETVISTPPPRSVQAAKNGFTLVVDESVIRPLSLEEARAAGLTIVTDQSIIRRVSSDGTNSRVRPAEEPPSRPHGEGPNKRRRHGCTNNDNTPSKRPHLDEQAASSSGNQQRRKCARRHMFAASTKM